METYRRRYFKLFSAMADAVEAIERMDFGTAKEILVKAQQETEEAVLSQEE